MDSQKTRDSENPPVNQWDADLYDSKHFFVAQFGADLLELLAAKRGDRVLDLGCGTGHLTHQIATNGAEVVGIDSAPTMISQAQKSYPNLHFEVMDGANLQFTEQFDAVFSNAALHWIKEADKVVEGVWRSLKPGGRFVAEFGGKGNVNAIVTAIYNAFQSAGYPADGTLNPWYFPSIGEYGKLLEKQGLELTFASLFDRPTRLEDGENGMRNWIKMFANSFFNAIPDDEQPRLMAEIENQLRPKLYENGTWFADYRRIRVMAIK